MQSVPQDKQAAALQSGLGGARLETIDNAAEAGREVRQSGAWRLLARAVLWFNG